MNIGDLVDGGFAEIKTGPFGTQLRASDYVDSGRPVLNVRNVGFGDVRQNKLEYIDEKTAERLSGHLLRPRDIVFGRKGAVERHAFISTAFAGAIQGSDCIRLRVSSDSPISAGFITFALRTEEHQAWMQAFCSHGATMASLNQDIVRQIPLPAIDPQHQCLAVAILQTIDDLIENNRRRVELLEETARAIYREWFVHFRYPGHNSLALVDSALGLIPHGWDVKCLGDISKNFDRLRKPLSRVERQKNPGSVPYYGAAKLIDWVDGWIFDGEYLLFAEDGSVQTVNGFPVLQLVEGRFWANNHTHILQGNGVSTRYLKLAAASQPIAGYVTGAAQPKITQANLNRIPFLVGSPRIHDAFDRAVNPVFDSLHVLSMQTDSLATMRAILLPKLVTGQVDVSSLDLDALLQEARV